MMFKPTLIAALFAAMATTAVSQSPLPSAPPEILAPPQSQPPAQPPAAAAPVEGVASFIARQEAGQFLGEDLEDMKVYTPDGRGIGEIDDLLIDQSGRVVAVVIEVGGFLGIREKRIAVPIGSLTFERPTAATNDPDNTRIVMRISRDELDRAPPFKAWDDR